MKKSLIIIFFLFVTPLIYAGFFDELFGSGSDSGNGIEKTTGMLEMKKTFSKDETFLAELSGVFLYPVTKENLFLYKRHIRIPIEPNIAKINEKYYIYFQLLGKELGNYSFIIDDISYYKGVELSNEPIIANFSISENTADFFVSPGFIVTDKDFSVELQNLKSSSIEIQTSSTFGSDTLTLLSGEKKKANFKPNFSEPVFEKIKVSTSNLIYEIPVYFYGNQTQNQSYLNQSSVPEIPTEEVLEFQPFSLNISLATNSSKEKILYIYNNGTAKIENISLHPSYFLGKYLTILPERFDELEADSAGKIIINISSGFEEEIIEGQIKARAENFSIALPVTLNFIVGYIPANESIKEPEIYLNCSKIGGVFCSSPQQCIGENVYARDGVCCLGECKKPDGKAGRTTNWRLIGFAIIFLLVIILLWFFKNKYKKAEKGVDLLSIAKGK